MNPPLPKYVTERALTKWIAAAEDIVEVLESLAACSKVHLRSAAHTHLIVFGFLLLIA